MPNQSFVSIIIPCYNYAHFLEESVGSVIEQTYTNWECLIIDDGSTDDTKAVAVELMKKDSRVKYYYQQNKGLSAARNLGLSMAKGDYFQFLDADDMIHPQKLKEQVEILDNDLSIGVSYTNYQTFKGKISNLTGRYSHLTLGDKPLEDFLFKWEMGLSIPIHAALFRRSLLAKTGKPFIEELKAKEDWTMWVKLAADGANFSFLDKDYCFYREHPSSQTADLKDMFSYYVKAVFRILDLIPSSYHEKFIDSSLIHAEKFYLNLISRATLFWDSGKGFNSDDAIFEDIRIRGKLSFQLSYDLSNIGTIKQLRFDPLEGYWIKAKVNNIRYLTKTNEMKDLDISKVSSNGTILEDGHTLFQTFDPMFFLPITGELQKISLSGEMCVLENHQITQLIDEKERVLKRSIKEKEHLIASVKYALQEKEQLIASVKLALQEKEQEVAEFAKTLTEKEQVIEKTVQQMQDLDHNYQISFAKIEQKNQEIDNILNSRSWRLTAPLRMLGQKVRQAIISMNRMFLLCRKGIASIRREGLKATLEKIKSYKLYNKIEQEELYDLWLKNNSLTAADVIRIKQSKKMFSYKPLISCIVPVYNVEEKWLRKCLDSVINQLYPNWELCIADDASTEPHICKVLEEYNEKDQRIKVVYREKNGHISAASNSALNLATGEFIALLDHDDELTVDALYENVLLLNDHPQADMIYSDEDKIDENGKRYSPFFKPDWSPDTFLSQMYTCHLGVYRTSLIKEINGFREGFEGSQDYDLVLRLTEKTKSIFHIPKILYHWRAITNSTASNPQAKNYAHQTGLKAIEKALSRRNERADIYGIPNHQGCYCVNYLLDREPLISILIPTKDQAEVLNNCLESIYEKTTYSNYEIIIIDNGSTQNEAFKVFDRWQHYFKEKLIVKQMDIPFNFSKLNNEAVKSANGDLILLLNNDIEISTAGWLEKMSGQAKRKSIGAVGAKLLYPDDTIQHAGVVLGIGGVAGHSHKYFASGSIGYYSRLLINSNYSAVTAACLMVETEHYQRVGGLDEIMPVAFNDVDFCLKLSSEGLYNIVLPDVQLYHHESKSRGAEDTPEKQERFAAEVQLMKERWGELLQKDPFYNPNLTLDREDFSIKV